jgi:hypothetical protein
MTQLPKLMNPAAKLGARTFSKNGALIRKLRLSCYALPTTIPRATGQIASQDRSWTAAPADREKAALIEKVGVLLIAYQNRWRFSGFVVQKTVDVVDPITFAQRERDRVISEQMDQYNVSGSLCAIVIHVSLPQHIDLSCRVSSRSICRLRTEANRWSISICNSDKRSWKSERRRR